ncbi:guanylate kinase-associated protein mars isoform X2 [Galleria mellonella]|uniref:Guanylate kinase-associated protein mars isoform X2 n=1 Tax=Galleria mellonella TaxID=7137 RepID=A0A6J3CAA9_GALME|nr:guanylate kinase-associated protein mars isoform X2 [Galleria mellonella]
MHETVVKNRLETNLKIRRSSRLTVFDKIRNLPKCESPEPLSEAELKVQRRRQQLEKWKEDKEKRKKELAAQKKKPFVTGIPHAPLKFVPPPPPPKPVLSSGRITAPSTSGRVTRSQSAKNNAAKKDHKVQSFAPKNATFRPPQIKNLTKVPVLAPVTKNKKDIKEYIFKFNSISNNGSKENPPKQTRSKTTNKLPASKVNTHKKEKAAENRTIKSRLTKKVSPKPPKIAEKLLSSSSSSSMGKSSSEESSVGKSRTPRKSIRMDSNNFTPKNNMPKSESSSEEKLRSPKSNDIGMTPEQIIEESKRISPCVTLSRGKDNARKEMKKKMDEGLLDEDTGAIDSVDHFRRQLNSEITRLTEMCDLWEKIREQTPLVDSVQDEVLGAIGQGRLLMSSKLQQFAGLVERCARPEPGAALVTPADLHGFWDMVFMQIENIDMRFKRLEERRMRGWAEEVTEAAAKPRRNAQASKRPVRAPQPAGNSRLRDMIAAARKAKKEQEVQPEVVASPAAGDSKTFEAGFFCVRSPVRTSPVFSTPSKPSLLKTVLSSEAKKSASKNTTSFAMLRASLMSRNLESDGVAPLPQTPLTPVNLQATPGRSILKSTSKTVSKSGKKSIKVVLFDQSDTEQETQSNNEENKQTEVQDNTEVITDSGLSSMDVEKSENKENSKRKSRLTRQDAVQEDRSPVVTRSRRKSLQMSQEEGRSRRSSRRKTLQETDENTPSEVVPTPKRSSRRRKSSTLQSVIA